MTGSQWRDRITTTLLKQCLLVDVDAMNEYMNRVALQTFSYFDTGDRASGAEPERFYHGFVLGLLVDLQDRYYLKSNRESGFGRYDVMLEPKNPGKDNAVILNLKCARQEKKKVWKRQRSLQSHRFGKENTAKN